MSGRAAELIVAVLFIAIEMQFVQRWTHSLFGVAAAAIFVITVNLGVGRAWRVAFRRLWESDLEQPLAGLAALGITVGLSASSVPVCLVAFWLAGLG